VAHLGYLQIDTIFVIERSHHHILYTRIPAYRREHLEQAQSIDKTVFEFWAHALAYLPTESMRFFVRPMRQARQDGGRHTWLGKVSATDVSRLVSRIRKDGALSIRDINDEPVEKAYAWASRKPSKRLLELAFYMGFLTISQRAGMLKTYELMTRHFGWERLPRAATETETLNYLLDRALKAQGIVSVESACYMDVPRKPAMRRLVEARVRRKQLIPVQLEGAGELPHWVRPETLDAMPDPAQEQVHILSPFDPVIIQRKRLQLFFDYEYRFEAYVPKHKRVFGYFVCPVLIGDRMVAALDLKTERLQQRLLVQRWNWIGKSKSRAHRQQVEAALHRFEEFQLGRSATKE
jgi:uncharacterized protein YcaQ